MAQKSPIGTIPKDYDSGDDYCESEEYEAFPVRKRSLSTIGMDSKGRTKAIGQQQTPMVSLTSKRVESATPYKLRPMKLGERFTESAVAQEEKSLSRISEKLRSNFERELKECLEAYDKFPLRNIQDSPHLIDTTGFDENGLKEWSLSVQKWDLAEKRRKTTLKQIRFLQEQLASSIVKPNEIGKTGTYMRPLKVDRHLPIPKFTRTLSRDKPFYLWYKLFRREMLRLEADNKYCLAALIYYVDKECFSPWQESLSPEDMNDLDLVLSHLDKEFPDRCTPEERRSAFRNWSHSKADVLDYSNNKERLFRLAYPEKDPNTSATYKDYWLLGLNKKLETLLRRSIRVEMRPVSFLVAEAVRIEQDELAVNKARYLRHFPRVHEDRKPNSDKKTPILANKPIGKLSGQRDEISRNIPYKQRDKTSSVTRTSRQEETEMVKGTCFSYQKTGKCSRGQDCPYEHPLKSAKAASTGGDGKSKDLKM